MPAIQAGEHPLFSTAPLVTIRMASHLSKDTQETDKAQNRYTIYFGNMPSRIYICCLIKSKVVYFFANPQPS